MSESQDLRCPLRVITSYVRHVTSMNSPVVLISSNQQECDMSIEEFAICYKSQCAAWDSVNNQCTASIDAGGSL